MEPIHWSEEVEKRKASLISETQQLLKIKSVLDEERATPEAPLGSGVKQALQFMLTLGEKEGFIAKNIGNVAGHLEFGEGEEIVGILCHVDVVPEGDGWTSDPFGAEIRDGKIFARGAIDDKGPTMAAFYAMKIVKELGLPLKRRVRMIIGTDEESDWRCVEHYFKHEEMPQMGFAPDADFPIIYAEKGISDFEILMKTGLDREANGDVEVLEFSSGRRYNMVPDFATASLYVPTIQTVIVQQYKEFKKKYKLEGNCHVDQGILILNLHGVSAHGMEPDNGKNAGLFMANFLAGLKLDENAQKYFKFVSSYLGQESRGQAFNIAYSDDITGDLTINVGKLEYTKQAGGKLGINLRYPVTMDFENVLDRLKKLLTKAGFTVGNFSNSKPHHVDENEFLIQKLKKVYEEQTGEPATLLSIGGGTYARSLKSGVAFGPLFPGSPDIAHQKDEYMVIEDMLKATAIYAQAIYELAGNID
ncbi:dipeptidase PepV [Bacillus sp. B15-48]|uniref:dipeptidase PepV n=1 Tax=Bacillus sp. B15-48 TaxID=1548601 RepID=UPI00193F85A7|nr:dipeptidase PepV [Bacillus sp. B15-48]MBM4762613.1 dipeptidase PepV [Bacillus sp. B15-48]